MKNRAPYEALYMFIWISVYPSISRIFSAAAGASLAWSARE